MILKKENIENEIVKIYKDDNHSFEYTYTSENVEDTIFLASIFAKNIKKTSILVLNGELGTGKTIFMSGIAKYYNIENQISSPTFTIVNEYTLQNGIDKIFHFDVYRLEDENDFLDSIGTEYFSNGICVIEWGNIIQSILPKNSIFIDIQKDENDYEKRYFKIWRK